MAVRVGMPVVSMMPVVVPITVPPRRARMVQFPVQFLDALAVSPHNVPDMADAVKIQLQLVDLPHDLGEAGYLGVCRVNDVAGVVVLLQRDNLALLAQILDSRLDLLH